MNKIPAFIIMYNRLTWPKAMAEYLSDTGCEVILVDNGSTYPPLLEWYEKCPYKIFKLNANFGHQVLWTCSIIDNNYPDIKHYIVSDPDLDLHDIPKDYLELLLTEVSLHKQVQVSKVGFSLEIEGLPVNAYTEEVIKWEKPNWERTGGTNGFYLADIDTTFALYDKERFAFNGLFYRALRSPRPYTAYHLPWHFTKESFLKSEEQQFYYKEIDKGINSVSSSHWATAFKKAFY